jgi:hypothetical protein
MADIAALRGLGIPLNSQGTEEHRRQARTDNEVTNLNAAINIGDGKWPQLCSAWAKLAASVLGS